MALKSTHKSAAQTPLQPGWTEHKAPTGHMYYYNAATKESTYTRPAVDTPAPVLPPANNSYAAAPSLADPRVANQFMAQFNNHSQPQHGREGHRGGRGGHEGRPRPQPIDKPVRKETIPGFEPWILVYTKYSRRFTYNPTKNTSYWRIPEKMMPAILEMDKARIRKAAGIETGEPEEDSEYEEVTDDENDEGQQADPEHASKRPRLEVKDGDEGEEEDEDEEEEEEEDEDEEEEEEEDEEDDDEPVEFTEADIAMQLQAMGEAYDLDAGDYDDGDMENWPEGAEGLEFSHEDAKLLFKDLLNDLRISPYSPWEKLLEEGKIVEDQRYTALSTTKERKECWDEWTRERIADIKEQRARQAKTDPRIPYLGLLAEKATPKLYWPEFKRKYKKEDAMKDAKVSDKDREKMYREHINRLKMPQATLKADLTALLKAQSAVHLHSQTKTDELPESILTDLRYISLGPEVRNPLIEAYASTLPPPPEDVAAVQESEEQAKQREAKEKRQRALQEHNRMVDEQERRRERDVAHSRARLRDEERELEMAMRVGKRGLQSQLAGMKDAEQPAEE